MSFQTLPLTNDELEGLLGILNINIFNARLNVYQKMKTISDDQADAIGKRKYELELLAEPLTRRGGMKAMSKRRRSTRRGSRKRRSCKKQ